MNKNLETLRDDILMAALPDAAFDGWDFDTVLESANKAGIERDKVRAAFPDKRPQLLDHFADWADRKMLEKLSSLDIEPMRIRDRVRTAVQTRLQILSPHQEALRHSLAFWALPFRQATAVKIVWRSADRIWEWAGDIATDYNRYTKRGLLSGILTSTTLVFVNDHDPKMRTTLEFLDRRIDNVMTIGKVINRFKAS